MVEKKGDVVTPDMIKLFKNPDEPILFQTNINKLSRYGFSQGRVLAVTMEHIYVFESGKISRRHDIRHLHAIIKSQKTP